MTAHSVNNQEGTKHPKEDATDQYLQTRWSTGTMPTAWFVGDLGSKKAFKRVFIAWEVAFATDYDIQGSDDATTWTTLKEVRGGDSFWDTIDVDGNHRYVKMNGLARGKTDVGNDLFGYSMWDISVCAMGPGTSVRPLQGANGGQKKAWRLQVRPSGHPVGIGPAFDVQGRALRQSKATVPVVEGSPSTR